MSLILPGVGAGAATTTLPLGAFVNGNSLGAGGPPADCPGFWRFTCSFTAGAQK